jgi:hypothetical protein
MRRAAGALTVALLLGVVAEGLLARPNPDLPWWHGTPGVWAVFGVVGCLAIVLASKWLGRVWLQRPDAEREDD